MATHQPVRVSQIAARQQLEARLLLELKTAEAAFQSALPEEKAEAGRQYREALDRFNDLILNRRAPGPPRH
jgi:DNA-binding FadR family transcriptional regulator